MTCLHNSEAEKTKENMFIYGSNVCLFSIYFLRENQCRPACKGAPQLPAQMPGDMCSMIKPGELARRASSGRWPWPIP